ncbi:MAG: exonuclease SbcCD subunit D [Gammaproteobacteria bacterium]|nr:exonuclease SbcCD subunit D [Gammaproteobacteria bacterium]MCP5424831.1 exonuclease SbcCD subunit D [Gammaproteobacteria bacterium]MCP5458192.1 exonuclease SbcCD subunit D [Gammaproteobacteria bacterium]
MRFIHTADWHIGRFLHNLSLLDEQAHVLDQFCRIVEDSRPHAVVIAGDVYDRAIPPADAVRLLSEVVSRIAMDSRIPLIVIAGNHDSPDRLGFGSALLDRQNLFLRGPLSQPMEPVVIDAEGERVNFYPIPYAEPAVVRERFGVSEAHSHDAAMQAVIARIREQGMAASRRTVAVAHCFVAGGAESESERPLSVGGVGQVDSSRFAGFDYVALGHLHRPQAVGANIHYAGSLLKYSFSEASHPKSITLVELPDQGGRRVERIPLAPRHDLRIVEGRLPDLLQGPKAGESREDYLLVRLLDKEALLEPMGKLREIYPNVLHLERPGLFKEGALADVGRDQLRRGEQELFASFFEQMTREPLTDAERQVFADVVEALRRSERESPP